MERLRPGACTVGAVLLTSLGFDGAVAAEPDLPPPALMAGSPASPAWVPSPYGQMGLVAEPVMRSPAAIPEAEPSEAILPGRSGGAFFETGHGDIRSVGDTAAVEPGDPAGDEQIASIEPLPSPPIPNTTGPVIRALAVPMPQQPLDVDLEKVPLSSEREMKPVLETALALRERTGIAGLSRLSEAGVPIEAMYTPMYGTFRLAATPTYLDAGHIPAGRLGGFGTYPFAAAVFPGVAVAGIHDQSAGGVGLAGGYSYGPFSADLGSTPLGFPVEHVIGSVALGPRFMGNRLQVRLEILRQPVTDTMLSYAGTRDPASGEIWGGVAQTGGRFTVAYDDGPWGFHIGGGGGWLRGEHVKDNGELDAAIGGFYRPYQARRAEIRIGIDLSYMGYDNNLRYFTLGQGGYFSPQNYVNLAMPVTFTGRIGRLALLASAAPGVQAFREKNSAYFPNDPVTQELTEDASGIGAATYPGRRVLGPSFDVSGQAEWAFDRGFALGARAGADNLRDRAEGVVKLYLRKTFDPRAIGPIFPELRPSRW
ncbi:MAG: BCSC C-terminal domain-containing protein [Alphaproteobacteria bacterium]|nr:BCSC C-terminal domain-containing protein [Alphaproteobacteria bacterium]